MRFRRLGPDAESGRAAASEPSDVEIPMAFSRFDRRCLPPPEIFCTESAESTATIWRCSSARAAALGGGGWALSALVARTPAPSVSTAERKTRARFSAGVGMHEDRARSPRSGIDRMRAHTLHWRIASEYRTVCCRECHRAFVRRQQCISFFLLHAAPLLSQSRCCSRRPRLHPPPVRKALPRSSIRSASRCLARVRRGPSWTDSARAFSWRPGTRS